MKIENIIANQHLVESVIKKILGSSPDQEDLKQEVLIKLLEKRESFINPKNNQDGDRCIRSWISTVTRNMVFDYLRKNKTKNIIKIYELYEKTNYGFEEYTYSEEVIDNFLKKVNSILNPEEILFLKLKYLEKQTFKDIAEEHNLHIEKLKSMVQRTKQKLRQNINYESLTTS